MQLVHFCAVMQMRDMARTPQQASLDYLHHVLDRMKMSPSALAKLAGIASTTLTRPLNDPDHRFALSTTTLDRLRHITGYDYAPFLSSDQDTLARTIDMLDKDDYHRDKPPAPEKPFEAIAVVGEVQAGVWREYAFQPDEHLFVIFLAPTRPEMIGNTIGLIVRGESMNKVAREYDMLVVEAIQRSGTKPRDGDMVIVERQRDQDGIIELSAKRLRGNQLVPESDDPRFQAPLRLGEHEGETVRIIGIVHYVVRQP